MSQRQFAYGTTYSQPGMFIDSDMNLWLGPTAPESTMHFAKAFGMRNEETGGHATERVIWVLEASELPDDCIPLRGFKGFEPPEESETWETAEASDAEQQETDIAGEALAALQQLKEAYAKALEYANKLQVGSERFAILSARIRRSWLPGRWVLRTDDRDAWEANALGRAIDTMQLDGNEFAKMIRAIPPLPGGLMKAMNRASQTLEKHA